MEQLNVKSVLITGANRGIGLEYVKQILSLPNAPQHVFATYRDEKGSEELLTLAKDNSNLEAIKFEITDYDKIPALVKAIRDKVGNAGLTLLINNAGILQPSKTIQDTTAEDMSKSYNVNTIAPLMLFKHMTPLIKQAAEGNSAADNLTANRAAIVYISTKVASIADNSGGGVYAYRCSKVAANMMMKNLSVELKGAGILCLTLHPGWVQTDLGGKNAIHGLTDSVSGMIKVIAGAKDTDHGHFYDFKGHTIPW